MSSKPASYSSQSNLTASDLQPEPTKDVVIKLQTVQFQRVKVKRYEPGQTIGQKIDELLRDNDERGRIPTKLVLDLNPPREEDELRME